MLMQQWLLSRQEVREFLPTRLMVAYPEPWMDRVDSMKKLQGWTDVSVLHFRNLALYGEQILLSIRFGAWTDVADPAQAANWARYWRPEIQGYIHAYRAATGVELAPGGAVMRVSTDRFAQPTSHLRARRASRLPLPSPSPDGKAAAPVDGKVSRNGVPTRNVGQEIPLE